MPYLLIGEPQAFAQELGKRNISTAYMQEIVQQLPHYDTRFYVRCTAYDHNDNMIIKVERLAWQGLKIGIDAPEKTVKAFQAMITKKCAKAKEPIYKSLRKHKITVRNGIVSFDQDKVNIA